MLDNDCTFENGGFCAWYNALGNADDFDWTVGSGSTSSGSTGPSMDRNGNKTGDSLHRFLQ